MMGLLNSQSLDWDRVKYGAGYGEELVTLCDAGITPSRTVSFVSLVNGTIDDSRNHSIKHNINLIDVAGDDFATKVAKRPDAQVSFADMGEDLPKLLANNNDKVFFIVVDPTSDLAIYTREEENPDRPGTKNSVTYTVPQKNTLMRFLSMLRQEENKKIMEKVSALHIIVTKSDTLADNREERKKKAKEIVQERYAHILRPLKELCVRHHINPTLKDNAPALFTFSLGTFYFGGVFDYDSTDSDEILNVIADLTRGQKKLTAWDRIKKWFNS